MNIITVIASDSVPGTFGRRSETTLPVSSEDGWSCLPLHTLSVEVPVHCTGSRPIACTSLGARIRQYDRISERTRPDLEVIVDSNSTHWQRGALWPKPNPLSRERIDGPAVPAAQMQEGQLPRPKPARSVC